MSRGASGQEGLSTPLSLPISEALPVLGSWLRIVSCDGNKARYGTKPYLGPTEDCLAWCGMRTGFRYVFCQRL
ncbi:hypothetical protein MPNT_110056 [Candidatus Methylacidithermus pantelleriae]|uniref:Uncharacterized protein n=1 Tax=Candidatus Methylacidithermus pantelleriae TaxID=2744239 RepID=A0A8J2BGN8_9BACT|nr:hypothetical protein MPNT_110056 [Candidatus Methylacidithermus pantelleriae]